MIVHWDEVEGFDIPASVHPLGGRWQRLGDAAGTVDVGCQRVRVPEGLLLTPPHVHTGEEKIFHILSGNATLWQDGRTCTVSESDTIVHAARGSRAPRSTSRTSIRGRRRRGSVCPRASRASGRRTSARSATLGATTTA